MVEELTNVSNYTKTDRNSAGGWLTHSTGQQPPPREPSQNMTEQRLDGERLMCLSAGRCAGGRSFMQRGKEPTEKPSFTRVLRERRMILKWSSDCEQQGCNVTALTGGASFSHLIHSQHICEFQIMREMMRAPFKVILKFVSQCSDWNWNHWHLWEFSCYEKEGKQKWNLTFHQPSLF